MSQATGRGLRPLLVQPAFVIIVIVATVHVIRSAPVDAVVTYAVAAALLVEQAWLRGRVDERPASGVAVGAVRQPVAEVIGVLVTAVSLGWLAGHWELYDWRFKVVTALPGLAVALLLFTRRRPDAAAAPDRPARYGWLWAAVGVAICLQELVSFVQQPNPQDGSYDHPTISILVEPLLASPLARGCLLTGWLAVGYVLLRRTGLLERAR